MPIRFVNLFIVTGSSSTCPLFLRAISFEGTTKRACNDLNQNIIGFIFEQPSTQFTRWILYWGIFLFLHIIVVVKNVWTFCFSGFGVFYKNSISVFTYQNSIQIFRGSLCRILSGVGEISFFLLYPYNTPKYTISDPYWMQNNLLFDKPFVCSITKTQPIDYAALFTCFLWCYFPPFHRFGIMSLGSKKLEFFHDMAQTGSNSNLRFSTTILPLITVFNFIKFYTSTLKVLYWLIAPGKGK